MNNHHNDVKLGAIFGTGRCGTTWLGAMVSSHPEVAYRFEPFHRLKKTQPEIAAALEQIRSENFSSQDLNKIYQALLPAHPETEKPPFFSKSYGMNFPLGRAFTWSLARKTSWGEKLFSHLYLPQGNPTLIFKEVAMVDVLAKLLNLNQVPIVYLLRHPCGVVSSLLKGQKDSLMPSGRRSVLLNLLNEHQPHLAKKYEGQLPQMHLSEQEALLWLVDVEQAIQVCQANSNALIVVYEQLVEKPLETLEKIFTHFDLTMNSQSVDFIEMSTQSSLNSKIKAGEFGINKYFSVFRNSQSCCDRWKQELSTEDIQRVMQIIQDSKGYALGVATGLWA
ncbi:MAG: sulfotransferase [Pleurocapsa sp. MO_192.B19]|nr:sulfotransferase [Pleurocapsa sp. MO_192.B19]